MKRSALCAALLLSIACGSSDPPNPTTPTNLTLPTNPEAIYTLSGTVRDDAGAPMQGVSVFVGHDPRYPGSFGTADTDATGRYFISRLLPGKNDVTAQKPRYVMVSDSVVIGTVLIKDFSLHPGVFVGGSTNELDVGRLGDVTITVVSGANAGTATKSTPWGAWTLGPILPAEIRLRASKDGYESVELSVNTDADRVPTVDFTLKWAYGTCLTSVTPVLFDRFASAGGTASVSVGAVAGQSWTAKPDSPWITVVSGGTGKGPGTISFRVDSNPIGAFDARTGAMMIRCGAAGGQNVWVNQVPNCQVSLDAPPLAVFPAAGGFGRMPVHGGVAGCHWQDVSEADWIRLVGAGGYMTQEVDFVVASNPTGMDRSATVVAGETPFTVRQSR